MCVCDSFWFFGGSAVAMAMAMNVYGAFSIYIFKCALQAIDLWERSDISMYRRRWQPLSGLK